MAIAVLVVTSTRGYAPAAPVAECSRRLATVAAHEGRGRARTLGRCVAEIVACPAAIESTGTAATDRCLRRAGARCRARLIGLARLGTRATHVRDGCAARLGPESLLGDDGLGYARLAASCGVEIPDAAAAFACQTTALACTAAATVGTLAPRATELLLRAGVAVDGDRACFDATECGNGTLADEEECDDGPANSDGRPDACRTTCLDAFCGDGVADDGEDCDDGNPNDGDGCDADCVAEDGTCGDDVVSSDEECDDGNRHDRDGCDADCFLEPGVCGDGVLDDDEECDDGIANADTLADHCRRDCTDPICGDGVIDPDIGDECEPPGTLLCNEACELRVPFLLGARARTPEDGIVACQQTLVRGGLRVAGRTRALVDRCVQSVGRCLLALDESSPAVDRCLGRATRLCAGAADRRDALLARAADAVGSRCAAVALGDALGAGTGGLGFGAAARTCPAGAATPSTSDLVACVLDRARCLGERTVAESVPRAYELLFEVEDDPEDRFACVVDPDELGSPSGAFVDGR